MTYSHGGPRLYSIAPGAPFLESFVKAFLKGDLYPEQSKRARCDHNFYDFKDPLTLAQTDIYVPTMRAARALREVFSRFTEKESCFLPRIFSFNEFNENEEYYSFAFQNKALLTPKIDDLSRVLLLAELIQPWRERLPTHIRALFGTENIELPTGGADSIYLAFALAALMDEIESENADIQQLEKLIPLELAEWWQITVQFLQILFQEWPKILKERGLVSRETWRKNLLGEQIKIWQKTPPQNPIIALGSTGHIPIIADILKVIAHLPYGAVILPGLDRDLDEKSWQAIENTEEEPSLFGHPQYALKKLLQTLGARREDVIFLGEVAPKKRAREQLISTALRPANSTDHWLFIDKLALGEAQEKITLIEASNEYEEALTIAIAMREAIVEPDKITALITNDRNLARRVSAQLRRFGIIASDSIGQPLRQSVNVNLITLILECYFNPGSFVSFLALLKHPLMKLGQKRAQLRQMTELFETVFLRKKDNITLFYKEISLNTLDAFIDAHFSAWPVSRQEAHRELVDYFRNIAKKLKDAVKPFENIAWDQTCFIKDFIEATIKCAENFAKDENGSLAEFYEGEAGTALMQFWQSVLTEHSSFCFYAREWPDVFHALLSKISLNPKPYGHRRVLILGRMGARLQTVDHVILGGLNEDKMPENTGQDPFMSRAMKRLINLPAAEYHIGLAAHDFQMALGMDEVFLVRALQSKSEPSVASRWLQRIAAVLGEEHFQKMQQRGKKYISYARQIDKGKTIPFSQRPNPKPALIKRPKVFSVTEIEVLRRNPYAIYAKKILKLRPLDPIGRENSLRVRGLLYHEILEDFIKKIKNAHLSEYHIIMHEIMQEKFHKIQLPPDVEALWWERFQALIPKYLAFETHNDAIEKFVEVQSLLIPIGETGVELIGRADRIDKIGHNHACILDIKTTKYPKKADTISLRAPQLALEAALLERKAFSQCGVSEIAGLFYLRFLDKGEFIAEDICKTSYNSDPISIKALANKAWTQLEALIHLYQDEGKGYICNALPPLSAYRVEYDHLARVFEWSQEVASGQSENL